MSYKYVNLELAMLQIPDQYLIQYQQSSKKKHRHKKHKHRDLNNDLKVDGLGITGVDGNLKYYLVDIISINRYNRKRFKTLWLTLKYVQYYVLSYLCNGLS